MTVIGQDENILKELEARQKLIPFVPSATSYGMGWKTLQAVRYRKSPASGQFSLPPVSWHGIVLTIRPAEKFEARYDEVRIDRPPVAGSINVIPAGSSLEWRRQGSMDGLPSILTRLSSRESRPSRLASIRVAECCHRCTA